VHNVNGISNSISPGFSRKTLSVTEFRGKARRQTEANNPGLWGRSVVRSISRRRRPKLDKRTVWNGF